MDKAKVDNEKQNGGLDNEKQNGGRLTVKIKEFNDVLRVAGCIMYFCIIKN